MLGTHILENPEIDIQHEVIHAHVEALHELLSDELQLHLIQPVLSRLRELLVAHFAHEESFMNEHRQKHRDMLDLLEQCLVSSSVTGKDALERMLNNDGNQSGPLDEHDGRYFVETVNKLIDSIRSHELQNPNMAL
jgi:hypothetical protein